VAVCSLSLLELNIVRSMASVEGSWQLATSTYVYICVAQCRCGMRSLSEVSETHRALEIQAAECMISGVMSLLLQKIRLPGPAPASFTGRPSPPGSASGEPGFVQVSRSADLKSSRKTTVWVAMFVRGRARGEIVSSWAL